MSQTLEAMKGGGGSIKVGATGTISTLMTMDMEQKATPRRPSSSRNKHQTQAIPVSIACCSGTQKRPQLRKSSDEGSCSKSSEMARKKTRASSRRTHEIPMLDSEAISTLQKTPSREKIQKKMQNLAEIVDVKCGNPEKAGAIALTSRLKKLGFSKLSESIA